MMKSRIAGPLVALALLAGCGESATQPDDGLEPDTFDILIGGDVSFLAEIEDNGGTYSDADGEKDLLLLMKEHGFESIRLRLWHTPAGSYNDLEQVKAMAARIGAAGMELFLDFHYSDWWADAGTQNKPAAWSALTFDVLVDSVYQYSHDVVASLRSQGTVPAMVQIGNEISSGMLWPDGRVGGVYDTPQQWDQLVELLDAGRRGILDAAPNQRSEIVIHFSNGADNAACRWFFDGLAARGLQYDAIGVSYYPKWHGSLAQLRSNLNDLASRYQRDVYVVETAYPWTFDWVDDAHNIWGSESDLHPGYPATVAGQSDFLRALRNIVAVVPGGRGGGIYYWSPEWIAVQGVPSAWENATLFDFDGKMLPSMEAFTGME